MGRSVPILAPLVLAQAYAILGAGSFLLLRGTGWAAPVWPAAGLAFAAVMAAGRRMVAGVGLGAFLLNLAIYRLAGLGLAVTVGVSLVIAAAIALQALAGRALVHRLLGRQPLLERSSEILRFMLLAGPAACLIGPTIGTLTLLQAHLLLPAQADRAWLTWWVGDSIGVIVFAPLALMLLPSQERLWRGRRLPVAVPSLVVLALSLAIFLLSAQIEERAWNQRLQSRANLAAEALRRSLQQQVEALLAVRSVVAVSGPLSPDAFRRFTAGSLERHPGLKAISWNPLLRPEELAAFESRWRRMPGFEGFRITERGPDGSLRPVLPHRRHVPVVSIEPLARNRAALGFDIATEPIRADALDRAIATGRVQATAPIRLVQETGDQRGVLLVLPVHSGQKGFAVGVVRCRDLLAETFSEEIWESFRFRLLDRSPGEPPRELARLERSSSSSPSPSRLVSTPSYAVRRSLEEAGRRWELEVEPTPLFVEQAGPLRSPALLLGGLLISGLTESFLLLTTGTERRHQRELEQKLRTSLVAAAVAHEIKQPLTSMLLQARFLERGLRRGEVPGDRERELLEAAEGVGRDARAVSRTIDRIRDILANVVSHLAPLDIADPIRGALLVARADLSRERIQLRCEGLDPPHRIEGDREQIQLVILNLLRNAIEAAGAGGTVLIAVRPRDGAVEVEVADDGPGFDPSIRGIDDLLLESGKPGGSGIGLYLVRCVMDNHQGRVRLGRSSLGGASILLEFR